MLVYIMRHGQTDWNRLGRIQGSSDIPLNAEGIRIAEAAAEGMRREGITFDRIYSSPYKRAHKTAEIVGGASGVPVIDDERIREMGFGTYEGCDYERLKQTDDNIRVCFEDPDRYRPAYGAESYEDVLGRVRDFLEHEIRPLEADPDVRSVLVVCHGAVIRAFLSIIKDLPLSEFWNMSQPNCCVNVIECRNGSFEIIKERMLFYNRQSDCHNG